MMALTDQDKDWVKLMIKDTISVSTELMVEKILAVHVQLCPYGKMLSKSKWFLAGILFCLGAMGREIAITTFEFISKIMAG